jgi:hypothetical protein
LYFRGGDHSATDPRQRNMRQTPRVSLRVKPAIDFRIRALVLGEPGNHGRLPTQTGQLGQFSVIDCFTLPNCRTRLSSKGEAIKRAR